MKISNKKHVQQLASLLLAKGITDVIISPGSRNGPLIHTFSGSGLFNCRNIVDERSAGYFALGLAQTLQKPVVVVCSSGTAALNYTPAVAEAFYQKIPLIVLTADRPAYWIDQAESQCINQKGIYQNFVRKEVHLPLGETEKELWQAGRDINLALNLALSCTRAPVHINIPLEEPLHDLQETSLPDTKIITQEETNATFSELAINRWKTSFNAAEKVLILAGQQPPNPELEVVLLKLVQKTKAVVLREHLANLNGADFCGSIDTTMAAILADRPEDFKPDLLITFGGQFVSKSLKQFLRKNKPEEHWHLSVANEHFDTYQALNEVIKSDASAFIRELLPKLESKEITYLQRWKTKEKQVNALRDEYLDQVAFSDLLVFNEIAKAVPENTVIHLGNSSPVRYSLICNTKNSITYYGNRGTSGIDGSMSTAVGFAAESAQINTLIIGDLSFFYDSNALWNKYLSDNLRIIVVNNGGGNIFGLIKGPGGSPAYREHFLAENKLPVKGIAEAYGLEYLKAENDSELSSALKELYAPNRNKAIVLDVFTEESTNIETFRGLFKAVKQ